MFSWWLLLGSDPEQDVNVMDTLGQNTVPTMGFDQSSLCQEDGKEITAMGASRVLYASLCEYVFKDTANLQSTTVW